MAVTRQQVAELYVATFNRAPDAAGLDYWVNDSGLTIEQIAQSFFDQPETQALYPVGNTNSAFVTSIYTNLFNRAPDADGLAYWVAELDNATMTRDVMIEAMKNGATGTDATIIANKATVGLAYADAGYESTDISLASVTEVQSTVDAMLVPVTVASHTLTTTTDVIESTGRDTFTATSATFGAADIISDNSSTDADVMNITATAALAAATVSNVETINVNLNLFNGSATDVDATNITGATINLASTKLGFDGVSGVAAAGANTVVAGSGITTLTVAGLTTGTVDTGSATTATVTGTAARANTIKVNGNIALTNNTSTLTTLEATADSVVTYVTGATLKTTVTGAGNVELKMVDADIVAGASLVNSNTGTVTLRAIGTTPSSIDATNFAVDKIIVGAAATTAAVVASGATLETSAAMTSLTISTTSAAAGTATLNAGHNITTLVVSDDDLVTTINANTANISIGTLTSTDETVNIAGSKTVTIGATTDGTVNASALTGALTYTASNGTTQTVTGGSGANTVTTNITTVLSYTGGTAVDTIDATAVLTGTLAAELGAGNDVVKFDTLGASVIALDGGTGTDTLKITAAGDTSTASTFAVSNFEAIQVQATANSSVDAQTLTMASSHLSGKTYAVSAQEAIDTVDLTVAGTTTNNTIDLSAITMVAGSTVDITANATTGTTVETIKGTNVADTFTSATGLHSLTGGEGDDVFTFTTGVSTATLLTKITDFQAAAASSDNDKLDITSGAVVGDKTIDVFAQTSGSTDEYASAAAIFADAAAGVNLVVEDGFMTIAATAADKALANTLAEYITLAQTVLSDAVLAANAVAFIYNGNTYIVEDTVAAGLNAAVGDATAATLGTVDNVIELTGLTTAVALSTSAAASTIWIA